MTSGSPVGDCSSRSSVRVCERVVAGSSLTETPFFLRRYRNLKCAFRQMSSKTQAPYDVDYVAARQKTLSIPKKYVETGKIRREGSDFAFHPLLLSHLVSELTH